ncbi:MAG: YciK family oxidoreductase [Porticoccaceae bacterium]|nr:MAG: YciK family oxidoreductase [Porticoccaceae bacterium]
MPSSLLEYRPAPDLLADKVILVTGAGDGIGRAAALAFARHGATVVLAGRTVAKLEAVYDEITAAGLPTPTIYPVDLAGAGEEDYRALAHALDAHFGRLDGLLHNAGILGQRTPLARYPLRLWEEVLRVNLTAPFLMTQKLLPVLEKAPAASVVFTSSGVGRRGKAYWGAYAVSKFAIEGLTQVWADEVEGVSRIRVNCINPGPTRTAMRAAAYPAEDPNRLRPPEAIMGAYLYLMGDDSRHVNGQSLDAQ